MEEIKTQTGEKMNIKIIDVLALLGIGYIGVHFIVWAMFGFKIVGLN